MLQGAVSFQVVATPTMGRAITAWRETPMA